jgi:hypothetical protein
MKRAMSPDDAAAGKPSPERTDQPRQPRLTPGALAGKAGRAERVAAEMRRNLLKRKQRQRQKQGEA